MHQGNLLNNNVVIRGAIIWYTANINSIEMPNLWILKPFLIIRIQQLGKFEKALTAKAK